MNMLASNIAKQEDISFQADLYDHPNATRRGLHQNRRLWVESAICENLLPEGSVLEIGVGCGTFTRFLSKLGASVLAVDVNPAFIMGVANLAGVTPVLADATQQIDLSEHDLAVCSEVIEHVPAERSLRLLQTLNRGLKLEGRLILTTPHRYSIVEMVARMLKFSPVLALARRLYGNADELGHINLLTSRQLITQIHHAGFKIEKSCRFGFYFPVIAEFGGKRGWKFLQKIERVLQRLPVIDQLLWTQAYVLKKCGPIN